MGPLEEADIILRAWGSPEDLNITGMVNTTIKNAKETIVNSKVYVVEGFKPEPLLGDKDVEHLGFVTFNKDGGAPPATPVRRIPHLVNQTLKTLRR